MRLTLAAVLVFRIKTTFVAAATVYSRSSLLVGVKPLNIRTMFLAFANCFNVFFNFGSHPS